MNKNSRILIDPAFILPNFEIINPANIRAKLSEYPGWL